MSNEGFVEDLMLMELGLWFDISLITLDLNLALMGPNSWHGLDFMLVELRLWFNISLITLYLNWVLMGPNSEPDLDFDLSFSLNGIIRWLNEALVWLGLQFKQC